MANEREELLPPDREQERPVPGNRGLRLCTAIFQVAKRRPKCTLCASALIIVTMAAVSGILVTVPVWKTGYRRNLMKITNFTHGDTYLTDVFNSPSSFKFCSSVTLNTDYTTGNFTAILELFQTKPNLTDKDTLLATYNKIIPFDNYQLLWTFHLNRDAYLDMNVVAKQQEPNCSRSRRDGFTVAIIRGYDNYTKWSKATDQDYMEYAVYLKSFDVDNHEHSVKHKYSSDGEYYHVVENSLNTPLCNISVTASARVTRTLYSYNRLASHCKVYWNKPTCSKTSDRAHYGLVIINEENDTVKLHKINTSITLFCIPNCQLYTGLGIGAAFTVILVSLLVLLGLCYCTRVCDNHPHAGEDEEHSLELMEEQPDPPPQSGSLLGPAPPPSNDSSLNQSCGSPHLARPLEISGYVKSSRALSDSEVENFHHAQILSAQDSGPQRRTVIGAPQSLHTAVDTLHERSGGPTEATACTSSTHLTTTLDS